MKKHLVLFREPDGRTIQHTDEKMKNHQQNWKNWFSALAQSGKLNGGSGLSLTGRLIKGKGVIVTNEIHKNGDEIVGGYVLLIVANYEEAAEIMKSCPIYEFDGYAEIRELQNQN